MDTKYTPEPAAVDRLTMTRRQYHRTDGWTPEVQEDFIVALIEHGSVQRAATIVDRHITSAYRLRNRKPGFASAWDAARRVAYARLRDEAMDRALNGSLQEVWYHGERTGMKTVHNDRLLIALLNHLKYEAPPRAVVPGTVDDEEDGRSKATAAVLALLANPPPPPVPALVRLRPARGRHPGSAAQAAVNETASHP